jgi:hypothetical protein
MNAQNFTRKTRIAGLSALGLAAGLALSACTASGSSAGATATKTATPHASAAATPQASATTPATPASTPGSSPAGGSGAGGQSLVLVGCGAGAPAVKPATYRLGCFNAINTLTDLHWTTWGQTATATGTEELNSCVPDCAPSQTFSYPVSIEMSGSGSRVTGSGTLHVYLYVTITYSGTMPTLQPGEAAGVVTQTNGNSRTVEMDNSR